MNMKSTYAQQKQAFSLCLLMLTSSIFAQNNAFHVFTSLPQSIQSKSKEIHIQADHTGLRMHQKREFNFNERNQLVIRKDKFVGKDYTGQQGFGTAENAIAFEFSNQNFTGLRLSSHAISYKKQKDFSSFSHKASLGNGQNYRSFTIAQELEQSFAKNFSFNLLGGLVQCDDQQKNATQWLPTAKASLSYADDFLKTSVSYKIGPNSIEIFSPLDGAQMNRVLNFSSNFKLSKKFNLQLDCLQMNSKQMLDTAQKGHNILLAKASLSYQLKSKLQANFHYRLIEQGMQNISGYQGSKASLSLSYSAF